MQKEPLLGPSHIPIVQSPCEITYSNWYVSGKPNLEMLEIKYKIKNKLTEVTCASVQTTKTTKNCQAFYPVFNQMKL